MIELIEKLKEEASRCISCGFCESVCPTLPASGYNLSRGARGRVILGLELAKSIKSGTELKLSDSFYSCLDCYACLQVCPAGVNAGLVSHYAKGIIAERGKGENPFARMIVETTMRYMNPFGPRERFAEWARGLKLSERSQNLLYTGNMYQIMEQSRALSKIRRAMGERLSKILAGAVADFPYLIRAGAMFSENDIRARMNLFLRNIARLLQMAGVDFSYMGSEEPYPGTLIYDLGYLDEFRAYANKVYSMIKGTGARRVITVDPHTYDLLKNVYPMFVEGFDLEIVFYTDMLKGLKLSRVEGIYVFHEPCHLVLHNDYSLPIDMLKSVAEVRLAGRSGKRSRCCGGPAELTFPDISEKVSEERYRDLMSTGAQYIVTACPICYINLSKGNNTLDLSEVLIKAAEGVQ